VGEGAGLGRARVLWWERGMTGCDTRTGEVAEVEATVERLGRENAPDETVGYFVVFELPATAGVAARVELTILAARSTQELLQVTDSAGGQGLVFDRVEVIDPPLNPLPTPPPATALQPIGSYLLAGTLGPAGPCLVLDLDQAAYSPEPNVPGTAGIRWWEPASADPDDPARCLMRRGDIRTDQATVMTIRGDAGTALGYTIVLDISVPATAPPEEAEIGILLDGSTREHLEAVAVRPLDGAALGFDRVDSIDPPLGP
jgi:hypothetical protein